MNNDGSNDRKDRKEHEKKTASSSSNKSTDVTHGLEKERVTATQVVPHITTGGHKSSTHPSTSKHRCSKCSNMVPKSATVCNSCKK